MCANPEDPIEDPNTCVVVKDAQNKVHWLQSCPADKPVCAFENAQFGVNAVCEAEPAEDKILPGEDCQANEECYSNVCSQSICKGKAAAQTCADHRDCDTGLFCSSITGTCSSQKQIGTVLKTNFYAYVFGSLVQVTMSV